jgi:Na+-driven multidrug efflux pump
MVAMIIPAIVNIILDIIFIKVMGFGMFGFSYVHFLFYVLPFVLWFFVYKSELRLKVRHFILHPPI